MNNKAKKERENNKETEEAKSLFIIQKIYLPDEIKDIILSFLPVRTRMLLSRQYYIDHHYLFKSMVKQDMYENYIRTMIRKDCDFVFRLILQENIKRWVHIKKYVYKNLIFSNYYFFLRLFCIENESPRCRRVLVVFLNESGVKINSARILHH